MRKDWKTLLATCGFALGICLLAGFFLFPAAPPVPRTPSKTPQQLLKNLAIAVKRGDERKIEALFETDAAYQELWNVKVDSTTSTVSETPLTRSADESGLTAWQRWFNRYGVAHIKWYETGHTKWYESWCSSEEGDFSMVITRTPMDI